MYVDDLIPTMANAVEFFKAGEVYNIGGTEYRSVQELSEMILKLTGGNPDLVCYLPEDKHNTVSKRPDIRKAVEELKHAPHILLEEGLPQTVAWMKAVSMEGYKIISGVVGISNNGQLCCPLLLNLSWRKIEKSVEYLQQCYVNLRIILFIYIF